MRRSCAALRLLCVQWLAAWASADRGGEALHAGFDAPPPAVDGAGHGAWFGGGAWGDGGDEEGFGVGSGGWAAERGPGRERDGDAGDAPGLAGAGPTTRPAADAAAQAVTVVVDTAKPLGLQLSGDLAVVSVAPEAPPSLARVIRPGDRLVGVDGRALPPSGTQYPLGRLRSWLHAPTPRWKQLRFLLANGASLASRAPGGGLEEGRIVVSLPRGVPHGMILAPATAPPEVSAFAPAVLLTARQRHALHAQMHASPQQDAHLVSTWLAAAEVLCAAVLIGGEQLPYAQRSGNASRALPFPGPRGTAGDPVAPAHAPAFGLARLGAFALPSSRRLPRAWRSRVLPHALRVHALVAGGAAGADDACALLRRRIGLADDEHVEGVPRPSTAPGAEAKPACRPCDRDAIPTASPVLLSGAVHPGARPPPPPVGGAGEPPSLPSHPPPLPRAQGMSWSRWREETYGARTGAGRWRCCWQRRRTPARRGAGRAWVSLARRARRGRRLRRGGPRPLPLPRGRRGDTAGPTPARGPPCASYFAGRWTAARPAGRRGRERALRLR